MNRYKRCGIVGWCGEFWGMAEMSDFGEMIIMLILSGLLKKGVAGGSCFITLSHVGGVESIS